MFCYYIIKRFTVEHQTRNWAFTLNNYTADELALFEYTKGVSISTFMNQIKYYSIGKEVGEEGTPHLQGFIVYYNPKLFSQVKRHLGDRFHIEKAQGTPQENIAYTQKDGDFIIYGDPPQKSGSRNDIKRVKEMIKEGKSLSEIYDEAPSYQSFRMAELGLQFRHIERKKPVVQWFWGPTGTGKTRHAIDIAEQMGIDYWISGDSLQWWQGYHGQKFVIIDDFRGDFCKFHQLLRILDRYRYMVQIKGSSMWLEAENIIITSCYKPEEVYNTREDIAQLLRRIDVVKEFGVSSSSPSSIV